MKKESIQDKYVFVKKIGEGAYGTVRIAHLKTDVNKKFAIKSLKRCKFDMAGLDSDDEDHHDHDHGNEDEKEEME